MKKKYILPFLIIAIMVLFVSCNNSDNNETNNRETEMVTQTETATADSSIETIETESDSLDTTQTDETQVTTKYFYYWDTIILHQPTEEKMELIHKGMSFMDVYEIIGAPHMLDPDDYNGYGLVWVADNGDSYCLQFSLNGADKDSFKSYAELYSNLTLDEEPYIVKTRFKYETSSKTASYTIDGVDYYQLYNHSDYYITIPYASVDDVRKVYKIIDGQPIDVTDNCVFFNDFLDVNIEHQPTIEDILMIQEGMTYKEIEAIIGRPHKCDPNLIDCYIWVTSEGNEYLLNLKSESIGKAICYSYTEYMNTTVLTYKVRRTKTCFLYEPELDTFMSASEATCTIDGVSYYQIEKHSNYYLTEPSANVVFGSRVYRFIDGQPVDVTEDCDWSGTVYSYWRQDWKPIYD